MIDKMNETIILGLICGIFLVGYIIWAIVDQERYEKKYPKETFEEHIKHCGCCEDLH